MFSIRSSESDTELVFLSHRGDYFDVELRSRQLSAAREVWAYTDAYGLADLFEFLAKQSRPWRGTEAWSSIEGEFSLSATCSSTGVVSFEVKLCHFGTSEEWKLRKRISSEFGQLPRFAEMARAFFGPSPE